MPYWHPESDKWTKGIASRRKYMAKVEKKVIAWKQVTREWSNGAPVPVL